MPRRTKKQTMRANARRIKEKNVFTGQRSLSRQSGFSQHDSAIARWAKDALKKGRIVSICSSCGNVKFGEKFFDSGASKEYWEAFSKRAKGKLSHGLCAFCYVKLYPDFAAERGIKPE